MTCPGPQKMIAIIADDDDLGRLLLAEGAMAAGLTPLVHDNGVAALDAALSNEVSIMLLDVEMPGMDGLAMCRRLRAEPRFANVPIVIVTGHEDAGAISRAFEAGATDFIPKPVNWALLPHRLAYILRNAANVNDLSERETQVRTLVEALPDRLWVVADSGEIHWSSGAVSATTVAQGNQELQGLHHVLAPPAQRTAALAAIAQTAIDGQQRKIEYRERGEGEAEHSFELRFNRRAGGDVVVVRQDTSERTAAAARIEHLAYFDSLTGLPNRLRCIEAADQLIAQAATSQESVAFVYMDLNGFKRINDTFGHPVGDAVLRIVAGKLAHALAAFDFVGDSVLLGRFGGDEFIILLRDAAARVLALRVAKACHAALKESIDYDGLEFFATPSIGVAVYPDDGADGTAVLKHADTAMYQAKHGSQSAVVAYTPAMSGRIRDWFELEGRLRHAVRQGSLYLHFQPKFRLRDNCLVGVEALLRWCDADYGEIPPTRFVAIAEESGLIIDMGSWVVRAACRQVRQWLDEGIAVPVAINVSGKELLHGDPARVVETECRAAGIPPSLIEIEITESVLIKESANVRAALNKFRDLGCRIALDDFGTGYSSLAYITRFPPDRIKIDKTFVRDVDRSAGDAAVASAILSLGEGLGILVTAEGIERSGQLEWLRKRGCHEAQGYLLARPMAARDLETRFLAVSALRAGQAVPGLHAAVGTGGAVREP